MTDALVKIIGMNINDGKPWENGDKLIAFFDCEVRGFRLNGCLLIKTVRGGFTAQVPRAENHRGEVRAVKIIDTQLRHHMMDAARRAYVAFGGTEGQFPGGQPI